MKRIVIIGAAALLVVRSFGGEAGQTNSTARPKASLKADDLFPDEVVARGKGIEIKRSQLDARVIELKSLNLARGTAAPPELEQQELQRLIGIGLLMAKATDADKVKSQEMSVKRLELTKTRAGSDEALQRQLKSVGLSEEQFRRQVTEETTAEAVVARELKIEVSDDEVKKFYDDNPARFEQPETVRVAHIQMNSRDTLTGDEVSPEKKAAKRKLMEEILKRARAGEDFAKLAKENTEDPNFKETNGEYKFGRGQPGIPSEFEAAAFALKTNELSDIVTTQYGYHIIKLLEKLPAKKMELATVAADVKEYLKQREMQKQFPDYIEKLKKEAAVEILDEKLKPRERSDATPPAPTPASANPGKK